MPRTLRFAGLTVVLAALLSTSGLRLTAADDKKDKTAPIFELYKDKEDEFRFRFKDEDGDNLASSGKGYKTKAECLKVIEAIKKEAPKAKVDDQTK